MDDLAWEDPPAATIMSSSSCLWSNHQHHGIGENSMASNSSGHGILGCKMDLPQVVFGPSMDSINAAPTATWGEAIMAQYPTLSGVIRDFSVVDGLQVVNGSEDGEAGVVSGATGSLQSLDCLLSATNSINTDTSVEDDGISMILSDCRNLWNFSSGSAVSSGESENIGSNGNSSGEAQLIYEVIGAPRISRRDIIPKTHKPIDEVISVSVPISQGFSRPLDSTTTGRPTSTNKRSKDGNGGHKVNRNYQYFDLLQSDSSTTEGGFQLISENLPRPKKPRLENHHQISSNINFQQPSSSCLSSSVDEPDTEAIAHMKEMIYQAAAFRPVNLGLMEVVEKPKRKNVRISSDPQTVAARHRRERISERIRVLHRLVPGGSKMDTATMLDEAANYLKFLRSQVKALENMGQKLDSMNCSSTNLPFPSPPFSFRYPFPMQTFFPFPKP